MKRKIWVYFLCVFVIGTGFLMLLSGCEKDEKKPHVEIPVEIPDNDFLNALIRQGVDKNEDAIISTSEAEAITLLDLSESHISNLTGIEAFINLDTLYCMRNQLTTLNVLNNIALELLYCDNSQLTTLDVSKNTSIQYLNIMNMPTLYKVCVWTIPFPPLGVDIDTTLSPNVYFTTDCSK